MKVFVSWSGDISHKAALAFKEWLPQVIQSIDPYVSSEDIQMGARWSADVEKALEDSRFGIICVTEDNLTAPWLNFEAGALSKAIENARVNVCPFLFNIRPSSVKGPLSQFQMCSNERDEVLKLVSGINTAQNEKERVKSHILEGSFRAFWPTLEQKLREIVEGSASVPLPKRKSEDMLEEILEIVRSQNRLTASRQDVFDVAQWIDKKLDTVELRVGGSASGIMSGLPGGVLSGLAFPTISTDGNFVPSANAYADLARAMGNIEIDNPVLPVSSPQSVPSVLDVSKLSTEETKKKE